MGKQSYKLQKIIGTGKSTLLLSPRT